MKKIIFSCLMLFIISNFLHSQNIITVDNSPGANAQYNNLQDAIDAPTTVNGDIIYVHPSETTYGSVVVTKSLDLIGFGHSDPDKNTTIANIDLDEGASNTTISGFNITNDFTIDNPSVTITNIVFENNKAEETKFSNAGVASMIIRGNVIDYVGSVSNGSTANQFTNTIIENNVINFNLYTRFVNSITVRNNLFLDAGIANTIPANGVQVIQNSIFLASTSNQRNVNDPTVSFENCMSYNYGTGDFAVLTGSNNIDNQNPLFVSNDNPSFDAGTDDFNLQVGSPAIGTGASGGDIGLIGSGSFVFNNLGYTNGIPTVKITAISQTVAPGQNVEVTIETNTNN